MAYLPLSTANLPDPVIDPAQGASPEDYFDVDIYSGDLTASREFSNLNFQPDFLWFKSRSNAVSHVLVDSIRGATKHLSSNTTDAESTPTYPYISSFDSDGWTMDDGNLSGGNTLGRTYVTWAWKANGSGTTNTDGSITSTVSANTTSGFSIVSYTGDGVGNFTVGHGLNSAPEFVVVKRRDSASNWYCWHEGLSSGAYVIYLNATNAQASEPTVWNSTVPTSSVFTIGTDANLRAAGNHIAYCFHSVEGFSKFGSYVGNGSADGPFVYTGFRPAFVIVKSTSTQNWYIMDTARNPYNEQYVASYADLSNAENTATTNHEQDFLSNGFKIRNTEAGYNTSGQTYIYMAFAEDGGPFKYSLAR